MKVTGVPAQILIPGLAAIITDGLEVALMVTSILNGLPAQVPEVGVTIYVTVIGPAVVLVKGPVENAGWFVPELRPVIPAFTGADQLNVVPAGITFPAPPNVPAEKSTLVPEQMAAGAWFAIVAFGLTVTTIG